jgi:hypothetical protein
MRLRKSLEERYDNLQTDALLTKVLSTQVQGDLDFEIESEAGSHEAKAKEDGVKEPA